MYAHELNNEVIYMGKARIIPCMVKNFLPSIKENRRNAEQAIKPFIWKDRRNDCSIYRCVSSLTYGSRYLFDFSLIVMIIELIHTQHEL